MTTEQIFTATARLTSQYEELIHHLVLFAQHGSTCNSLKPMMAFTTDGIAVTPATELGCTCGLQKVYDRIDELIE